MIDKLSYSQRLKSFSSTEKYQTELQFLYNLMLPIEDGESILDYGCGAGTTLRFLKKSTNAKIIGYDVQRYVDDDLTHLFINKIDGIYDKIIFQHSIAHITNIIDILMELRMNLLEHGKIYIITPNKDFDEYFKKMKDKNYIPDTTVYKHYDSTELIELFHYCGYTVKVSGTFGKVVSNVHERCFLIAQKN